MTEYAAATSAASQAGRAIAPTPLSRVASQQSLIDSNIDALRNAVDVLTERLQPVLGALSDAKVPGANSIKSVPTTVAQRMGESSEAICVQINRVMALVERLEI